MTKLLRRGIEAVEALPPDRQDLAGALLLELANAAPSESALTPKQIADVRAAIEEADRGLFVTEDEVKEAWKRFKR